MKNRKRKKQARKTVLLMFNDKMFHNGASNKGEKRERR